MYLFILLIVTPLALAAGFMFKLRRPYQLAGVSLFSWLGFALGRAVSDPTAFDDYSLWGNQFCVLGHGATVGSSQPPIVLPTALAIGAFAAGMILAGLARAVAHRQSFSQALERRSSPNGNGVGVSVPHIVGAGLLVVTTFSYATIVHLALPGSSVPGCADSISTAQERIALVTGGLLVAMGFVLEASKNRQVWSDRPQPSKVKV